MRREPKAEREARAALEAIYLPHRVAEGTVDFAEARRQAFMRDPTNRAWLLRWLQHADHAGCRLDVARALAKTWHMPFWQVTDLLRRMTRELALDVLVGGR